MAACDAQAQQIIDALQQENHRLQLALNAAQAGTFIFTPADNHNVWDAGSRHIYGISPEMSVSQFQDWAQRIHPDDRQMVEMRELNALADPNRQTFDLDYRILRPDGEIRYVRAQAWITRDSSGKVVQLSGLHFDVTEQKMAQQRLHQSELRFRGIFEQTNAGIVFTNLQGLVLNANRAMVNMIGYSLEELQNRSIADMVLPQRAQFQAPLIDRLVQGEVDQVRFETSLTAKNGDQVWVDVSVSAIRDERGRVDGYVGMALNITKQKQAQEAIKMLSEAVEHSPASVVITDLDGTIEYVNRRFTEVTGYSWIEAVGQNPRLLKSGELTPNFYHEMWSTIKGGNEWHGEFHNRRRNGDLFWELASISPIKDERGRLTHFVAVKEEITQRKLMEEELRQAKDAAEAANRAKSVFLANMSHELRTPLNGILGFVQLLERDSTLSPAQSEKLAIIARSGDYLLKLINSVLELSKIEAGLMSVERRPFDLHNMVQDLENLFQARVNANRQHFAARMGEGLPRYILGDEGKLRQILTNLLGNAVKFTPGGGCVYLNVTYRTAEDGKETLMCEVQDSGPGIAPDEMPFIFDAFVQTSSGRKSGEGTGLGLAISRRFARLMEGDITIANLPGSGAGFTLLLPLERSQEGPEPAAQRRRVRRLASGQPAYRMLVVEDNPDSSQVLSELLTGVGFEVRQAANGLQGLEAWQSWLPHLVWMDIRMPGMDGLEATRRIKDLPGGKETPIIAITASALDFDQQPIRQAGCCDFVAKPFRFEDIFEHITRHLPVVFEYDDEPAPEAAPALSDTHERLPEAIVEPLRQAITTGRVREAHQLLATLPAELAPLVARLQDDLKRYRFQEVLNYLDE